MEGLVVGNVTVDGPALPAPNGHEGRTRRDADRLRIALVVPPYFDVPPKAYGGVEAVAADLADALVARGHRVTLVGAGENGTAADFLPVWPQTIPQRLGEPFPEWSTPH